MRLTVNIARVLVGTLFIFSGLVKAIDPLGLAYKMQEFFDVWKGDGIMVGLMDWLNGHALLFSVIMISLEVLLGMALLLGIWKKITSLLLLLLMIFFTFLTSYVLFSGKIRACGCFGDCIPLTPIQTFTKDIVLLMMVLLILFNKKYISPVFSNKAGYLVFLAGLVGVVGLQLYVLRHLPVKDCLPYKVGNNILELRKMPKDAVQDKFVYTFIYQKNGEKKEFKMDALPDSSWTYVDRKELLVEKGRNNTPLINDFSFTTESGNDTTTAILSQASEYYLLFVKDAETYPAGSDIGDGKLFLQAAKEKRPVYIITSQPDFAAKQFRNKYVIENKSYEPPIFTCDGVAIKTAARNNPVLFLMKGPVVQGKWAWTDFGKLIK